MRLLASVTDMNTGVTLGLMHFIMLGHVHEFVIITQVPVLTGFSKLRQF